MSWPVKVYYCNKCDFEQGDVRTWGTREYSLGSGIRIPVRGSIGWCMSCNGLAAIEDLSLTLRIKEYRKAELKFCQLSQKSGQLLSVLSKGERESLRYYEDNMQDAIDALEMLSNRISPAHCLNCYSTQVHVPEKLKDGVDGDQAAVWLHPKCGGELKPKKMMTVYG